MILKKIVNKFIIYLGKFGIYLGKNIGSNVDIYPGTKIHSDTKIGSYTYIGKNCNITKATIGRYCSIANNVSIGQGEHDLNQISTSSLFYDNSYEKLTMNDCFIAHDVWIGTDSIILRGVTVGNGAVVGANSVVTKDVPPYAIVVGSPARIIRFRFDEDKIEKIISSKWWELNLDDAKNIIERLENE